MVKIIIFTIPFIPLYISASMPFPYITGKNFAFRILVELAAALWIGLMAVKKEYRIYNSPLVLSVLAFTFIVGLADLLGVNPHESFWSNLERMEGCITILHLALYFMIIKSILRTRNDWKVFFSVALLVSVLISLFPLFFNLDDNSLAFRRQAIEYGTRVYSTIGNPPFLASYLLIASFAGLILTFHTQKTYLRLLYLMAVVLNGAVIYLTATRGAILAGVAGLMIFILMPAYTSRLRILKRALGLLLVVTIIAAGVLLIFINTDLTKHDLTISRFASIFTSESSRNRIDLWAMAWNGIKERPVLGWGQENFIGIYTVNPIISMGNQVWIDRAHNIIIEWLINAGALGLISYLAMFGTALFVLRKADRTELLSRGEAEIIFIALVVYFIQNLFTFDTINSYMIFFALLAYIDNHMPDDFQVHSGSKSSIDFNETKRYIGVTLAALICFSFIGYYINYKPISQTRQIIRISLSSPENDTYSLLLREVKHALSLNTFGDFYVKKSMMSMSDKIINMQYFDQEGALQFIQASVKELEKEIAVREYDFEFMTQVVKLFNKIAFDEPSFIGHSEMLINKMKLINPDYLWLNMLLADVYMLKKDYSSAFAMVKEVVSRKPENDEIQFRLALMAIYASRENDLKEALENVRKIRLSKNSNNNIENRPSLAIVELNKLYQVYAEMKLYVTALKHLKEIITILSEDKIYFDKDLYFYMPDTKARMRAQIHVKIARMYIMLNNKTNALQEAEKAMEIDPSLSVYIKKLIDSINNEI